MENDKKNDEFIKALQDTKDMVATLSRNQRLE